MICIGGKNNVHLKTRVLFLILICLTAMCWRKVKAIEPTVPKYTCEVYNAQELKKAVEDINRLSRDDYAIINIMSSFPINDCLDFTSAATKTIFGNGNTLYVGQIQADQTGYGSDPKRFPVDSFIVVWDGILNLGMQDKEKESRLTITQSQDATGSDSSSCLQVVSNHRNGKLHSPELNMYKGVLIDNWKVDNSYGAAVRVHSYEYEKGIHATFNMHGGTIRKCGFTSGSVQFGGGVAVLHNGIFNMYDGVITECSAYCGGGVCATHYSIVEQDILQGRISVDNPSVNMHGGEISNNTAILYETYGQGGGIANFNGRLTIDGGTITKNSSIQGGGISNNNGSNELRISNCTIIGNQARNGAGIYATKSVYVDKSSVTMNFASNIGGGIWAGTDADFTISITNSIFCNNAAGAGADFFIRPYDHTVTLNILSATGMKQKYKELTDIKPVKFDETPYYIDGWYVDYPAIYFKSDMLSGNFTKQDFTDGWLFLAANYSPYDQIDVIKEWDDVGDLLGKRPKEITFTVVDAGTLDPVKLREYDEIEQKWIASGENAVITLSKANADKEKENVWKGSIQPLLINNYGDNSKYLLKESGTGDYYELDGRSPIITFDSYGDGGLPETDAGIFTAKFLNRIHIPLELCVIWDDKDNVDRVRPEQVNIKLKDSFGNILKQANGEDAIITVTSKENWIKNVSMGPFDVSNVKIEVEAIEAYFQSEEAVIVKTEDGYRIESKNQHIPKKDESTPKPLGPSDNIENMPDTGDKSNLLYWIGMAFIGAVGIIVLLKRRKRKS